MLQDRSRRGPRLWSLGLVWNLGIRGKIAYHKDAPQSVRWQQKRMVHDRRVREEPENLEFCGCRATVSPPSMSGTHP